MPLQIAMCIFVGACSSLPAQPPAQLQYTPGPALVVGERTLQTDAYQVDPPAGWRIVKSTIASEPIVLVLVAPDETTVIQVGNRPVPTFAADEAFVQRDAVVTLPNDQAVYLTGQSTRENAESFDDVFEAVKRSIRLP
jgi:hypothetical protein